ncbi:MAG: hypothetical protein ACP5OK_09305, partial [Thermoprotei archaeon]
MANFDLQGGVKLKYSNTLYSTVAPIKGCNPQDLRKPSPFTVVQNFLVQDSITKFMQTMRTILRS